MTVCYLVKVKQGLVDGLLQLERHLHGIKACPPLIAVRLLQRSRLPIVTYLMNQNNINLLYIDIEKLLLKFHVEVVTVHKLHTPTVHTLSTTYLDVL